ncbi:hemolysin family protein [Siccirubricoccus sp. KC 17139]|uniref:Hemolysin family protein n=1 Tax=Siccirubricoccus soli TaxID=2899147 RepID=A0ABT1D1R8_9PROT|nr:hemolysin family protein [Siccirubricoccus soli]MCO6415846.1 hemolysin family protein [Siccirubricoccus soli]MCP2681978.1 hemolysin family protein [Siccirubricoccus soli]
MLEIAVVLVLVVLNGVFSLSELAVISARRPRLRAMADAGRPGAAAALALAEDPGRFLSTVQIGITLVGVLAGAFSGSALGGRLAAWLVGLGVPQSVAEPVGFGGVVALVTYLSIVIGELVPKRLGLRNPEGLACRMAPLMTVVSRVAAPVVWLLDGSSNLIFGLLGLGEEPEEKVTDEDLRALVAEAERHGTIETAERRMIAGVLRLGDRPVRGVMVPRGEVDWLDATAGEEEVRETLLRTTHSRLPVGDGSPDAMLGVVAARELLAALVRGEPLDLRARTLTAPVVPDTAEALDVLEILQGAEVPMALIHDEYGHFEGVVTPADLGHVIVGAFRSDMEAGEEPAAVRREDGSWLLAGWMAADEMAERLRIALPAERGYQTVAGFVLQAMGQLPRPGEAVEAQGWRFEVVDLDGRRIDKVLAAPVRAHAVRAARRPGAGPDPRGEVASSS